jgi:hypothetical protein
VPQIKYKAGTQKPHLFPELRHKLITDAVITVKLVAYTHTKPNYLKNFYEV